jgi:hypothetical protein
MVRGEEHAAGGTGMPVVDRLNLIFLWHFNQFAVDEHYCDQFEGFLSMLESTGFRCCLSISGLLLVGFRELRPGIVDRLSRLAQEGAIELLATNYSQVPTGFLGTGIDRAEIEDYLGLFTDLFGFLPGGFYPPERHFSRDLPGTLAGRFRYTFYDIHSFRRSVKISANGGQSPLTVNRTAGTGNTELDFFTVFDFGDFMSEFTPGLSPAETAGLFLRKAGMQLQIWKTPAGSRRVIAFSTDGEIFLRDISFKLKEGSLPDIFTALVAITKKDDKVDIALFREIERSVSRPVRCLPGAYRWLDQEMGGFRRLMQTPSSKKYVSLAKRHFETIRNLPLARSRSFARTLLLTSLFELGFDGSGDIPSWWQSDLWGTIIWDNWKYLRNFAQWASRASDPTGGRLVPVSPDRALPDLRVYRLDGRLIGFGKNGNLKIFFDRRKGLSFTCYELSGFLADIGAEVMRNVQPAMRIRKRALSVVPKEDLGNLEKYHLRKYSRHAMRDLFFDRLVLAGRESIVRFGEPEREGLSLLWESRINGVFIRKRAEILPDGASTVFRIGYDISVENPGVECSWIVASVLTVPGHEILVGTPSDWENFRGGLSVKSAHGTARLDWSGEPAITVENAYFGRAVNLEYSGIRGSASIICIFTVTAELLESAK